MATDPDSSTAGFDSIDWENVAGRGPLLGRRTAGFLLSLALLGALFCYDWLLVPGTEPTLGTQGGLNWDVTRLDWLFVASLLALSFYVVVPLVRNHQRTARYWRRLRTNRLAVASLGYLGGFLLVGTLGPLILGPPDPSFSAKYQPPMFATVDYGAVALSCIGEVTHAGANSRCHGTARYLLGTTRLGADVLTVAVAGMRTSLQVASVTAVIIVPLATAVGTVAGYAGGLLDDVLMRYVDVQQSMPAFLVYLVLIFVLERSLFLIVLVFGLLSWGGVARLVRSETLQRREEGFVIAARNAGMSRFRILRRHLLPNVSSTVITATTHLIPLLILAEAAIAFLNLGPATLPSWGQTIARGFESDYFLRTWWVWMVPLVLLVATVVAFSVLGDALRDALDPRGEP